MRGTAGLWLCIAPPTAHPAAARFPPCLPPGPRLSFPQLPRYILDEGKDLRIAGHIPTDAAPRGGFNAEGSEGKLKKGLDYPPVIYVAMQVWGGLGGRGSTWATGVGHCCCGSR